MRNVKDGDKCPHCRTGILIVVHGDGIYNLDYLMCNRCDSTFNITENR